MKDIKKKIILPSLVGLAAFAGIAGGSALSSISASADTTGSSSTSQSARPDMGPGHMGKRGDQVIVLGDTATKAKAAAEAAVTAATVGSDATAAKNAVYEAHVKKSDGTVVSVKMDASFKALSIDSMPKPPADAPKPQN